MMRQDSSATTWPSITRHLWAWHLHQGCFSPLPRNAHVVFILVHWSICCRFTIHSVWSAKFACWITSAEVASKWGLVAASHRLNSRTTAYRSWMHARFLRKHLMWLLQDCVMR